VLGTRAFAEEKSLFSLLEGVIEAARSVPVAQFQADLATTLPDWEDA